MQQKGKIPTDDELADVIRNLANEHGQPPRGHEFDQIKPGWCATYRAILNRRCVPVNAKSWAKLVQDLTGLTFIVRKYRLSDILADIERVSRNNEHWPLACTAKRYKAERSKKLYHVGYFLREEGYTQDAAGWTQFIRDHLNTDVYDVRHRNKFEESPVGNTEYTPEQRYDMFTSVGLPVSSVRSDGQRTYYMLR